MTPRLPSGWKAEGLSAGFRAAMLEEALVSHELPPFRSRFFRFKGISMIDMDGAWQVSGGNPL
jgi:hypothetical protein